MGSTHGVLATSRSAALRRNQQQHADLRAGGMGSGFEEQEWMSIGQVLHNRRQRIGQRRRQTVSGFPLPSLVPHPPRGRQATGPRHVLGDMGLCANCRQRLAGSTSQHQCNHCRHFVLCRSCYANRGMFHDGAHSFSLLAAGGGGGARPGGAEMSRLLQEVAVDFGRALMPLPVEQQPQQQPRRAEGSSGSAAPSDAGGAAAADAITGNIGNRSRYHCHSCNVSFLLDATSAAAAAAHDDVRCPRCHTGFVELVDTVAMESLDRVDIMLQELQRAFRIAVMQQVAGSWNGRNLSVPPGAGPGWLGGGTGRGGLILPQSQGRPPAPADALAALQDFPLRLSQLRASGPSCVICMEDWNEGDRVVRLPSCGHLFHRDCVVQWLESRDSCPMCRSKLDGPSPPSATSGPRGGSAAEQQQQPAGTALTIRRAVLPALVRSASTGSRDVGGGGGTPPSPTLSLSRSPVAGAAAAATPHGERDNSGDEGEDDWAEDHTERSGAVLVGSGADV